MENVLITGGAGYKGIKTAQHLLKQGHEVTILDNFMYGYEPVLHLLEYPKLHVIRQDIRNPIENLHSFDAVIHLAGISGYPACEANPSSAELINVVATKDLLEALDPRQLFIFASTTSFYGKGGNVCTEEAEIDPVSMYGITKKKAEEMIMQRENSISLRFATVFGPSPKMRLDLMVNDFTYRGLKEGCVVLFDSYAKRTFMHVDDVARCYGFSIEKQDAMKGGIFNAGGEHLNYSKLDIANHIKKFIDFKIIDSEVKDKDVRHFVVSYDKIRNLGFVPEKDLETGIKELLKMFSFYEYYSHFKTI